MTRALIFVFVAFATFLAWPRTANAYPWMIRHGYTQCGTCHVDPAGGGLLNPYGRAQGEILMRMRYGSPPNEEPTSLAEPVFGLVPAPRGLLFGAAGRLAYLRRIPLTGASEGRVILMQADVFAQYKLDRVRANGSVGYVDEGGLGAALTTGTEGKLVSRVHWVGVDLGKNDQVLVRAGRMNVPFGVRSVEHTMFTRSSTRTDLNTGQQHGVAVDFHEGRLRASAMAILGNFQIQQDRFRSRGFAGLVELALKPTLAVGVSSMATRAELDLSLLTPAWRHAHGAFARLSPTRLAVITAEADVLHTSQPTPGVTTVGGVGMVNVDLEPIQGLHVGPTLEVLSRDFDAAASYGAWTSVWWFFLPHADIRLDAIGQRLASPRGETAIVSTIVQLHVYL